MSATPDRAQVGERKQAPRTGPQQAISSSAGVAVQGTKYDYLVVYEKGHAANQLSNEVAMARVMLRDLG